MLSNFLTRKKSEYSIPLQSDSIKKIDAINSTWNLEREDAVSAIIDIAYLLHDMGTFPSSKSNTVARTNAEVKNGLIKVNYNELSNHHKEELSYLLEDLMKADNNAQSLSDKLSITIPTVTQLAQDIADKKSSENVKVRTLADLSSKEKRVVKAAIEAKYSGSNTSQSFKDDVINQICIEHNVNFKVAHHLLNQLELDRHSRSIQTGDKGNRTYESFSKKERKALKATIKEMINNKTATVTSIVAKLDLPKATAEKLFEQAKAELENELKLNSSSGRGYNSFTKKERIAIKDEIKDMFSKGIGENDIIDTIIHKHNLLPATAEKLLEHAKAESKPLGYDSFTKKERIAIKDEIRDMLSKDIDPKVTIMEKHNLLSDAAEKLLEQAIAEIKQVKYNSLTQKKRVSLKDEIRVMISEGIEPKTAIMKKHNLSPDAVSKLFEQLIAESKLDPKIVKALGDALDYEVLSKNDRKLLKGRIRTYIKSNGIPSGSKVDTYADSLAITKEALNTLLEQIKQEDKLDTAKNIDPTQALLNQYQQKIDDLLYEHGQMSIANIAAALKTTDSNIRTCLNAMAEARGEHPISLANRDYIKRKTADILRLKREEIHSDEDIMKMLNITESTFNSLLEKLYH